MRLAIAFGALALASACPDDWVNPCIIADRGNDMGPKNERWCGTSGPGYIGQVSGNSAGNQNYLNSFGQAMGLYDTSLNIGSYNGQGARHYSSSHWEYNGNKWRTLYSGSSHIYLQECSNICVNHPECTSFAFSSNENARNDEARWDDHAAGDVGHRFSGKTSSILRGRCWLYRYCDTKALHSSNNYKQWWLGTREDGAYDGTHAICKKKAELDDHCKNDNSCVKDCPAGQQLKTDSSGKNYCQACPTGTYKLGTNANQCQNCHVCPNGQYESNECTASSDTVCKTHSPNCGATSYEVVSAVSGNDGRDRQCALCDICAAGYEVDEGCRRTDPWVDQYWNSNGNGDASNAISVTQVVDIAGKVIIVHGPDGKKVGCGKLVRDAATGADEASVDVMPGYAGALKVSGKFLFKQLGTVVKGSYILQGLPAGAKGMFHVHAGSSCASPGGHYLNVEDSKPHSHRRLGGMKMRRLLAAGHPSTVGCQKNGNWPFFCDKAKAEEVSPKKSAHRMLGYWMPDDAPGMVMDGTYGGSALQCTDLCSDGNTVCRPCVPGATFSTGTDSPTCTQATECKVGQYMSQDSTVTSDRVCSACSNKPADSKYTGVGTSPECAWKCDDGFVEVAHGDGKNVCKKMGPKIVFKNKSKTMGTLVSFDNNVLQFNGFKCVEEPAFCGVKATLKQMEERIAALEKKTAHL